MCRLQAWWRLVRRDVQRCREPRPANRLERPAADVAARLGDDAGLLGVALAGGIMANRSIVGRKILLHRLAFKIGLFE